MIDDLEDLLRKGNSLKQEGKLSEAIFLFKKAIHLQPNDVRGHSGLGYTFRQLGNYEEAIYHLEEAISLQPNCYDFYLAAADVYSKAGQAKQAELLLYIVIERQPNFYQAYLMLGFALKLLGRYTEAISKITTAIQINPTCHKPYLAAADIYLIQIQTNSAVETLNKAIEQGVDKPELVYQKLADIFYKNEDFQASLTACRKAVQFHPESPIAHYSLGKTLLKLKLIDEALLACVEALRLDKNFIPALDLLAEIYELRMEFDQAISCYERITMLNPQASSFYIKLIRARSLHQSSNNLLRPNYSIKFLVTSGTYAGGYWLPDFASLYQNQIIFLKGKETFAKGDKVFYTVSLSNPEYLLEDFCKNLNKKHFLHEIPAFVKQLFFSRKAFLILDSSNEGPDFQAKYFQELHNIADKLSMPVGNIVWIQQNLALSEFYEQWLLKEKIQADSKLNFFYWHTFIVSLANEFSRIYPDQHALRDNFFKIALSDEVRRKYFLCFNSAPRPNRVFIILNLLKLGLLEKGLVSLGNLRNQKCNFYGFSSQELYKKLFPNYSNLLDYTSELEKKLPLTIDKPVDNESDSKVVDLDITPYAETYFSLVTETEMTTGSVIRFTEKIIKPIANFHPFIVAGNPGTLALIRSMGFKTFDNFFDESYDSIIDPEERAIHIIKEVNRLCAMTLPEIHDLYCSLAPILLYNAEHLLNYLPTWIRCRMGADILCGLRLLQTAE